MGQPGAKKTDQIVSVTPGDVHIIMVPSPGGPVPTPIPHPCSSVIQDGVADKVKVMGQPGAVKGSTSKHTPPHVPMGPGPFQKPPANKGEIVTASSNVFYESKEAAMLGDTGKMCADPADAPVGKVMGTAATVLIGGGGQGSDADRALAGALAMLAAAAACHAWIAANMPPGADRENAHRDVCAATGHPVDVVTGKVFTDASIVALPGRLPLHWLLDYSTARHAEPGPFGTGWRHSLQASLHVHDDFVAYRDWRGRFVPFPPPPPGGGRTTNATDGRVLERRADDWTVTARRDGLRYRFSSAARGEDGSLLLRAIEDGFGNRVQLDYDGAVLRGVSDAAGRHLAVRRTAEGRVAGVELQTPSGRWTVASFEYGAAGELLAIADGSGAARRYAYDRGLLVRETDRTGFSFHFQYDEAARCVRTWGDGGVFYRALAYDPVRRRTLVTDSRGGQTLYEGSPHGVATRQVDPLGGETSWTWDEFGRMTSLRDPNGGAYTYKYDERGRLAGVTNPEGGVTAVERDAAGRIVGVTRPDGRRLTTEWSAKGQIVAQVAEDGARYEYAWSAQGDLSEVRLDGRLTERRWHDAAGNLVRRERAGRTSAYRYDEAGRLLEVRDAAGGVAMFEPAAPGVTRGPVAVAIDGRAAKVEYDAEGRVLSTTDDAQGAPLRLSDYLWAVPRRRESGGLATRYDVDNELAIRAVRLGEAGAHEWTFDVAGRSLTRRVPWADGPFSYERDAGGRRVAVTDPVGRRVELRYDALDRLVGRRDPAARPHGERGAATVDSTFEYDDAGRVVATETPGVRLAVEWAQDGALVSETWDWREPRQVAVVATSDDGVLKLDEEPLFAYGVSAETGEVQITSPHWARPLRVRTAVGAAAAAAEDEHASLRTTLYPNGVREAARLDARGRPTRVDVIGPDGDRLARRSYRYENGRLRGSADDRRGSWSYDYDPYGRLLAARPETPPAPSQTAAGASREAPEARPMRLGYDALSNLTVVGREWRSTPHGRLHEADGTRFEYDALGNRIAQHAAGGRSTLFRYDVQGQMTSAVLSDGRRVDYEYDGLGRRVTKSVDGAGVCRFAWAGDRLLAEIHQDGRRRVFVFHPLSPVPAAWIEVAADGTTQSFFVHPDQRGLPLDVTDESGRVVWSAAFDPFGRLLWTNGDAEVDCPLRLPGQYADAETGLYYNHHRYYDPAVARYLTPDPLALAAGVNPYRYCLDPFTQRDPLGLCDSDGDGPCLAQILATNREIYHGSEALQTLTQAFNETDPARQAQLLRQAEILLQRDHGITVLDWRDDMTNRHGSGNYNQRTQRQAAEEGNRGMVLYDQRIVLIGGPATQPGQERANEMLHESGAILIADRNNPPGPEQLAADSNAWKDAIPSVPHPAGGQMHATHILDDIVRSGDGTVPQGGGGDFE